MSSNPTSTEKADQSVQPDFTVVDGCPCGHSCEHGPHEADLDHEPEPATGACECGHDHRVHGGAHGDWSDMSCRRCICIYFEARRGDAS